MKDSRLRGRKPNGRARRVAALLRGVLAALCLTLGLTTTEARAAADREKLEHRMAAARAALRAVVVAEAERAGCETPERKPSQVSQWWPNWPNWGNWPNWPNWGNWGNWYNR
jgi:hypothetical protein